MSRQVIAVCPFCKCQHTVPYKRRNRAGFCNRRCAAEYKRIHPLTEKACPACNFQFSTTNINQVYCCRDCSHVGYRGFKHSEETKAKMKALWTDEKREAASIPMLDANCEECKKTFRVRQYGKGSNQKFCSEQCYWDHLKHDNHMKDQSHRENMSRVASNRSPETRRKIGNAVSEAWKAGKFKNAAVGRCKWYHYQTKDGNVYKVQGVWELAFLDWMVQSGLHFLVHKTWVSYVDEDGVKRNWYPDFYVAEWKAWVDVKCDHFYRPEKFDCIRKCNPQISVCVLLREDLDGLGVRLYDKGSRYLPYIQDLIQRCSIQSGTRNQPTLFD